VEHTSLTERIVRSEIPALEDLVVTIVIDSPTPTLLQQFLAERVSAGVRLLWRIAGAPAGASIELERGEQPGGPWTLVARSPLGDGSGQHLDESTLSGHGYAYRLKLVGPDSGPAAVLGTIDVPSADGCGEELCLRVRTNRAGRARVDYGLPRPASAQMTILDVQGRIVARPIDGIVEAGSHQMVWPAAGTWVRPGVYFVRLTSAGATRIRRVAILE
jgi:hypothetical protein